MVRAIIDEHQAACEADAAVSSPEDESVIVDMLTIDFELNDEPRSLPWPQRRRRGELSRRGTQNRPGDEAGAAPQEGELL
jgi:hypothetical protein